jgi:hypothetical protein
MLIPVSREKTLLIETNTRCAKLPTSILNKVLKLAETCFKPVTGVPGLFVWLGWKEGGGRTGQG